ncbi:YcxB family protein [Massilia scottii]|uniref:YcxB family protein n=1 Tax=Massilia scottii TaxID=3057166 RepID=UPI0027967B31|nr:YcxB family protein [Massilia sp. CCM 9029]MDQ1835457.1 YcxB family protein [Massilia sp. CCM 9029]
MLFFYGIWLAFFGRASSELEWIGWLMLGVPVYFAWSFAVWIPRKVRKLYRQRKDLQRPLFYFIADTGLEVKTEGVVGVKPWTDYLKWKEGKSVLLLYISEDMFQIFPKHFFPSDDDLVMFKDLLREKIARHEV